METQGGVRWLESIERIDHDHRQLHGRLLLQRRGECIDPRDSLGAQMVRRVGHPPAIRDTRVRHPGETPGVGLRDENKQRC